MGMSRRFGGTGLATLSGAVAALAFVAQVASCGGDDSGPGAVDSGADQTADDGHVDSPIGPDAGDSGTVDAPADSKLDSGKDTSFDAPPLGSFNLVLAQTFCARLQSCCLATSSTWDEDKCVTILSNPAFGGVQGVGFAAAAFDGGHINYNPSLAGQCLQAVAAIPCGLVNTTQLNSIQSLCLSAVPGTIGSGGGGCTSSYECASAAFCKLPGADAGADAGTGTCTALVGSGGACTSEDMCSYLTNPPPSLYCDSQTHVCEPRLGTDAGCTNNSECTTNVCQFYPTGNKCTDKGIVSDPGVSNGTCAFFTIQDAGAD